MSFREKNLWIYAFLVTAVSAVYFASVVPQMGNRAIADISYQQPLLGAIGAVIVLTIVGSILAAIASPREAGKTDARDKEIGRLGQRVGFMLVGFPMLVPLGL